MFTLLISQFNNFPALRHENYYPCQSAIVKRQLLPKIKVTQGLYMS